MENKENQRFYHKWWFWSVAAMVVLSTVIMISLFTDKPEAPKGTLNVMTIDDTEKASALMTSSITEENSPANTAVLIENPDRTADEINALPVFDFGIEEWANTLGDMNAGIGLPAITANDVNKTPGQFTINQSNYVFYMGRTNERNETYSLMMGAYGDGSDEASAEILLSMAVMVGSLHPEYAPSDSGAVIRELGLLGGAMPQEAELTKDGTVYQFVNDPEFGILFFASPEN
jgi:hypothetical protein